MAAAVIEKSKYLTPFLVNQIDRAIDEAIQSVDDGKLTGASVTFSVTVALKDEDRVETTYAIKGSTTMKGPLNAAMFSQPRLEISE